ncbi:uncharacterized protein [Montipora capricornis]|uniref:uncharacterized protein n=1 Tax=Montipora capricornis TaxID=246305 RepID=UPI0035F152B3
MPPKKRSTPTTRSQSKRPRTSELTEETAESVTATPPPNLMTVDVQALSATISLAVTQAFQQALGQVKAPTPVTTEVVEASVQDEVSVLTEGIVPKKDPSEFRLIHHLSYPPGSSVNDFIPEDCSSVHYASINDAISVIKRKGAGCFMAKTDVKSAFRIIPIHPNDFALLGMKWQNSYYFDRCLPMGCSSSCAIFEAFSTALEWLAINRLGASGVLHILDDFLFIADSQDNCHADLTNFLGMCEYLGVPIAQEKTVGPDTTLQFAGITLDSVMQEARLPVDKLQKCRMLLRTFYKRRKVTLRELQSLLGLLNFTCSVIVPGRAFLRRMIDLTKGAKRPYHRIRLSKEAKSDMVTWLTFLDKFNGKTFFLDDRWDTSSSLDLFTDAAGSKGYGAIFGSVS